MKSRDNKKLFYRKYYVQLHYLDLPDVRHHPVSIDAALTHPFFLSLGRTEMLLKLILG
jgi:hypothetical protein